MQCDSQVTQPLYDHDHVCFIAPVGGRLDRESNPGPSVCKILCGTRNTDILQGWGERLKWATIDIHVAGNV